MGKIKILILGFLILVTSCSKNEGAPEFVSSDESMQREGAADESAVEERLAKEAGILHLIYHVGPVDLPANTSFEAMLEKPLTMNFQTDEPLWIIGFEPKVIDAAGEDLPSGLLYQAIISNTHEENPLCAESGIGNPFVAATSVLTKISLPEGYGYPVLPTDPLKASVVLHNPSSDNYIDVSFELNVIAKPMNEFTGMRDIKPILLDVDPCDHKPMQIEPEKFIERKVSFNIPSGGNIMVGHGILQNYSSYVELFKKTETIPFWRAEAILDNNHNILDLTSNPFEDPAGIKFKSGDSITLGVAYDNTEDKWFKGATGAAMIYLAPEE